MIDRPPAAAPPPRWAETALRLFVAARDRDTIAGDLVEEYREAILPRLGRAGARWWYLRQVVSLISSARLGLALGVVLALGAFAANVVLPVATSGFVDRDDPAPVAIVCLLLWAAAGWLAWRRTGSVAAAARAGAVAALVSMGCVMLAFLLIDNLFLDVVSRQPEKIWLFQHSHFHSMRTYINAAHARGALFVLPLLTAAGAVCGAAAAVAAKLAGAGAAAARRGA